MSRTDPQFKLRIPAALCTASVAARPGRAVRPSCTPLPKRRIVIRLESSFSQVAPSANEQERSE